MSKIYVDIGNSKNETNSALPKAKGQIAEIKTEVSSVKRNIYYKVQDRNNISNRLNNANNELSQIESKIQTLYYELNEFLDNYNYAEERILSSVVGDKGRSKSANELLFDVIKDTDVDPQITLSDIIRSILGITTTDNDSKINSLLELLFKTITGSIKSNNQKEKDIDTTKITKEVFDVFANFFDGVGDVSDDADLKFASPLIEYFSTLYGFSTTKYESGADATAGWLSLFDKSASLENALYKYFEKTLDPYQASKLYDKFGNGAAGLSIIGSIANFAKEGIESFQIFTDPNSKWYDKTGQLVDFWGSGVKTIGKTYIATDCSSKVLQFVSKPGNQILATELPELKFTSTKAAAQKLAKAQTYLALGDVAFSSISGGIKKYGQCMEDGEFTWKDAGSVGVSFSCDGLSAVGRGLTFGLVDIDGEAMAQNLEAKADEFVHGDSWAASYIRNEDNNVVLRFGVSVGSGAYLLGKEAVEGVTNGAKAVGGWVSNAWNGFKSIF